MKRLLVLLALGVCVGVSYKAYHDAKAARLVFQEALATFTMRVVTVERLQREQAQRERERELHWRLDDPDEILRSI